MAKEFKKLTQSNTRGLKKISKSNVKTLKTINKRNEAFMKKMNSWVRGSLAKEKRKHLSAKLRKQVEEKYKKKCDVCGKRNPLEIHHINLKNTDDRLANLRLLCPNHHTLEHQKYYKKKYPK